MSGNNIYPVPKFIQRFEERVERSWSTRWQRQAAEREHTLHVQFAPPGVPCRCRNCDSTADYKRNHHEVT